MGERDQDPEWPFSGLGLGCYKKHPSPRPQEEEREKGGRKKEKKKARTASHTGSHPKLFVRFRSLEPA